MKALREKYEHPLSRTMGRIAKKVGGHGGMDFIMDYRLFYCLKHGFPLDQDVCDAAAGSRVFPLSIARAGAYNDERAVLYSSVYP